MAQHVTILVSAYRAVSPVCSAAGISLAMATRSAPALKGEGGIFTLFSGLAWLFSARNLPKLWLPTTICKRRSAGTAPCCATRTHVACVAPARLSLSRSCPYGIQAFRVLLSCCINSSPFIPAHSAWLSQRRIIPHARISILLQHPARSSSLCCWRRIF